MTTPPQDRSLHVTGGPEALARDLAEHPELPKLDLGDMEMPEAVPEAEQYEAAELIVRAAFPSLADTLHDAERFLRRFVRFASPAQSAAATFWTAHSHAIGQAETSLYLSITSPEKRSGKTRLLETLELLVARPWRAVLPSEAVVYRKIAAVQPTLLLDEVDAIFGPKTAAQHEGLRALLNAGNRRGVTVPRIVGEGKKMRVEEFPVFGAKVIAGIGNLPDTIADRSIPIRLVRRAHGEEVERFRHREAEALAAPIREALAWYAETLDLDGSRPAIPEALDDRAADGWEPLLAIADAAGGEWPERARQAALALAGAREWDDDSLGVQLLADVRVVFEERGTDRTGTSELLDALREVEESPWAEGRDGRPLGAHGLSRLLRPYGIRGVERIGSRVARGYVRAEFAEAWQRYLPPSSAEPVQSVTPLRNEGTETPATLARNAVTVRNAPEREAEDRNAASSADELPWPTESPPDPDDYQDAAAIADEWSATIECHDYQAHRDHHGEWGRAGRVTSARGGLSA